MNTLSPDHIDHKNMLWLEVTNFCNLGCAHCYNSSGSRESLMPSISPERYEEILDEAKQIQFRCIQFIGGEPFFYPHLQRILDHALNLNFDYVEIFSNLTVLPQWVFEGSYKQVRLATSFYSDDPQVHDGICASKKSFERTTESIRKVVEAGFSLRAGFIEMPANAGHFERTSAYLTSLGVKSVGYDAVRQFGRAGQCATPDIRQLCGKCASGNLSIDVAGNTSACIMSKPWKFGNIRQDTLDAIFHSVGRREFADRLSVSSSECYPYSCDPYHGRTPGCGPNNCLPHCSPSCSPEYSCGPNL